MNKPTFRFLTLSVCFLMLLSCFASCEKSDGEAVEKSGITAINLFFQADSIELSVGEKSPKMHITVTSDGGFEREDIEFVCEKDGVAKINYENTTLTNFIYFNIEGAKEGETDVYFKAKNGSAMSDKIHVTVRDTDGKADTTAEITSEAMTSESATDNTSSNVQTYQQTEESYSPSQSAAAEQNSAPSPSPAPAPSGITVYVTPSGKKYHYSASCAGANASPIDKSEAALTREPCKKCVGGASDDTEYTAPSSEAVDNSQSYNDGTTVYITPTGKKYHLLASCAGKNAIPTTLESAAQTHEPCKKCAQ